MVWKQDLAQLKAQLKPDLEVNGPPAAPPKPTPPPPSNQSLEDADLLFLRAMGGVAVPLAPVVNHPLQVVSSELPPATGSPIESTSVVPVLKAATSTEDFAQALGDLKGLRPLLKNPVLSATSPSATPSPSVASASTPTVQPEVAALAPKLPEITESPVETSSPTVDEMAPSSAVPEAPRPRTGPILIHLAAGMAVEVDGTLDLRRHSLNDAKERLKERIHDGAALGWRTLLVTLGPNEALKQGFLAFLTTSDASLISRYAQAPIPMGGAQAWVLYLGRLNPLVNKSKEEA